MEDTNETRRMGQPSRNAQIDWETRHRTTKESNNKKKKRSILLRGEMNVTCECYRNPEVGEGVWGEAVRVLFDLSVNLGQDSSQR